MRNVAINILFCVQVFFDLESDEREVVSMSFDWISQKLYLGVSEGASDNLYSLDTSGRSSGRRQLTSVFSSIRRILAISVNPFAGLVSRY